MTIIFEFPSEYGTFRDALNFIDDQPIPSDDELTAMKQARFDIWYAVITTPVENPNPDAPVEE